MSAFDEGLDRHRLATTDIEVRFSAHRSYIVLGIEGCSDTYLTPAEAIELANALAGAFRYLERTAAERVG